MISRTAEEEEKRKKGFILGVKIAWICLVSLVTAYSGGAVLVSLGGALYYDYTRKIRAPSTESVSLEDPAAVRSAVRSLNYFYRDLKAETRKTFRRLGRDPERAALLWQKWEEVWLEDYKHFAKVYSLAAPENNKNQAVKELAQSYRQLQEIENSFSQNFKSLFLLSSSRVEIFDGMMRSVQDRMIVEPR